VRFNEPTFVQVSGFETNSNLGGLTRGGKRFSEPPDIATAVEVVGEADRGHMSHSCVTVVPYAPKKNGLNLKENQTVRGLGESE